jgi:RNA polymerase primary sigma factor
MVTPSNEGGDPNSDDEFELAEEAEEGLGVGEEMIGLAAEERLELDRAELAAELSEDPVRLYLREIGQVKLLDAAREFRLAAIIEGRRVILMSMRRQRMGKKGPEQPVTGAYRNLVGDLITAWTRLGEDSNRLKVDIPDPALILAEAQSLHQGWANGDAPSYLHSFVDRELWGKDPVWDSLVGNAYIIYAIFYDYQAMELALNYIRTHHDLPVQRTFFHNIPLNGTGQGGGNHPRKGG